MSVTLGAHQVLCTCQECYEQPFSVSDGYRESLVQLGVNPGRYAASLDRLDCLQVLADEGSESASSELEQLCDQMTRLCKDLDPGDLQYGVGGY
jgi:hypothetical protein